LAGFEWSWQDLLFITGFSLNILEKSTRNKKAKLHQSTRFA